MDKSVLEKIQDPPVQNKYNMTSTSQQYPPPQHCGRIPNIMDSGEGLSIGTIIILGIIFYAYQFFRSDDSDEKMRKRIQKEREDDYYADDPPD